MAIAVQHFGLTIQIDGKHPVTVDNDWKVLNDAAATAYQRRVWEVLHRLDSPKQTRVGSLVLRLMNSQGMQSGRMKTVIVPLPGTFKDSDKTTRADIAPVTIPASTAGSAEQFKVCKDARTNNNTDGTGAGSHTRLLFDPTPFLLRDQQLGLDPKNDGYTPETVLLHELVHAYRMMRGAQNCQPMGDGFDGLEEFYAILVENIYRSEQRLTLRANHAPVFQTLNDPFGPFWFYRRHHIEIDDLCWKMPELTNPLADTSNPIGDWNPLRERRRSLEGGYNNPF